MIGASAPQTLFCSTPNHLDVDFNSSSESDPLHSNSGAKYPLQLRRKLPSRRSMLPGAIFQIRSKSRRKHSDPFQITAQAFRSVLAQDQSISLIDFDFQKLSISRSFLHFHFQKAFQISNASSQILIRSKFRTLHPRSFRVGASSTAINSGASCKDIFGASSLGSIPAHPAEVSRHFILTCTLSFRTYLGASSPDGSRSLRTHLQKLSNSLFQTYNSFPKVQLVTCSRPDICYLNYTRPV